MVAAFAGDKFSRLVSWLAVATLRGCCFLHSGIIAPTGIGSTASSSPTISQPSRRCWSTPPPPLR
jgi:hypothetical protein